LNWALTQQDDNGWFRDAAFRPAEDPLTHTIAYTIRGFLESGILLDDQQLIQAARLAADALVRCQSEDGFIRATYGPAWKSQHTWSCLTGNAQLAVIWLRLYGLTGSEEYLAAAKMAAISVKRAQNRKSRIAGVAGGVAGSRPIYGDYEPYRNLNWAAKFFVDCLIMLECLDQGPAAG
jgi:hypothetical protein